MFLVFLLADTTVVYTVSELVKVKRFNQDVYNFCQHLLDCHHVILGSSHHENILHL